MEKILSELTSSSKKNFKTFFKVVPKIVNDSFTFFSKIEETESAFLKASAFALVAAALITLLSIPPYKIVKITLDSTFYTLHIVIAWILYFTYGFQVWLISRIFFGTPNILKTIAAFFYSLPVLVVSTLFEIPSKTIRANELSQCILSNEMTEHIRNTINASKYAIASEGYVLIGYAFYLIILFSLVKAVNGFGFWRSLIVSGMSLYSISLTVSFVQTPVIGTLLCAFKQG